MASLDSYSQQLNSQFSTFKSSPQKLFLDQTDPNLRKSSLLSSFYRLMQPRQDINQVFSTFIQFDCDRFSGWATDSQLRRSMRQSMTQVSPAPTSENFWALYWHKIWQTQPQGLAKQHLTAYLQEVCFWSTQKTVTGFTSNQYGLADCFQAAIAKIDKVLKGFNPERGFNLKSYASITFGNLIRELLRQRQEIDICSEWSLLRKLSQKRLTEALKYAGLDVHKVESYVLAWNCFRQIYVPERSSSTRQLKKPELATWQAIVELYNREGKAHPHLLQSATTQDLEQWMLICAQAARSYFNPQVTSLNQPKPGYDSGEIVDNLVGEVDNSLLANVISQEEVEERNQQQANIDRVLNEALQNLKADEQKLLELYYASELKQAEIAKRLGTQQYNISRKLSRVRKSLLMALSKWSKETLHISLTSDVLKGISSLLEEWLSSHYNNNS